MCDVLYPSHIYTNNKKVPATKTTQNALKYKAKTLYYYNGQNTRPKRRKTHSNIYKEEWTQPWPMGSEIYPEVHENPRTFFSRSSPILLESSIQCPYEVGLHLLAKCLTVAFICPPSLKMRGRSVALMSSVREQEVHLHGDSKCISNLCYFGRCLMSGV